MDKEDMSAEVKVLMEIVQRFGQRDGLPNSEMKLVIDDVTNVAYYSIDLGNPWYTGQFVSTIKNIGVKINNNTVDPEKVYFTLRGQRIQTETAKTLYELWWGMGELAQLQIKKDAIDQYIQKDKNDLEINMDMRSAMSYGIPDNTMNYQFTKTMEVI